jgi:hypothetical protein
LGERYQLLRRSFIDDLVSSRYGELDCGRFVPVDMSYGDDLLAGAGIIVSDDEVDTEVWRVPILVEDDDGLPSSTFFGGEDVLFFNAAQGRAVDRLFPEVDLFLGGAL